ncbi:hypothetical protein ABIB73_007506 [Bradyrhizobium sp. F1.4.3]|uniref:hypothetical protein n=1 Tax=Bradyrhizobium sp. F1.4.3 TaxID=3156356 RepID=UPI003391B380
MDPDHLRLRLFSEQNQELKKLMREVRGLRRIIALAETELQERQRLQAVTRNTLGLVIDASVGNTVASS